MEMERGNELSCRFFFRIYLELNVYTSCIFDLIIYYHYQVIVGGSFYYIMTTRILRRIVLVYPLMFARTIIVLLFSSCSNVWVGYAMYLLY